MYHPRRYDIKYRQDEGYAGGATRKNKEVEIQQTEATYKHSYEFCGRHFKTLRGMRIHRASCDKWHGLAENVFEIKKINAVFGTPKDRCLFFLE